MTAGAAIRVRPVTAATWDDFVRLFEARRSPHYCWCMVLRDRRSHLMSKDEKREAMAGLVQAGTPVGLLAYDGEEPVAWCSLAPRETFPKLEHSKAMPTGGLKPAWNVTCFFVRRSHRSRGLTGALLGAALDYASENGAAVLEGYPWDTSANKSRFKGHSSAFRQAGFARNGTRWHKALTGVDRGKAG